jgi:hypothetical protein
MIGMIRDPLQWERWPWARDLILRSVEPSDDRMEDVERELASGQAQLWVCDGMAGVTQLLQTKHGKQCFIWQLAGTWLPDGPALTAEVERWARAEGCMSIEANMRPGFERLLKWRKHTVVLRKVLA